MLYIFKQYQFVCDDCGTPAEAVNTGDVWGDIAVYSAKDATKALSQDGWKLAGKPHLCPRCREKDRELACTQ